MNKGAQWATFHGAAELDMTEWLSTWFFSMFLNCLDDSNVKPKFVCLKKKTKTLLLPLSAADLIPHFHENQKLFDEKSFIFLQESTEHCLFYLQILSQIGPHFTISTHSPSLNHHHLLPDLWSFPSASLILHVLFAINHSPPTFYTDVVNIKNILWLLISLRLQWDNLCQGLQYLCPPIPF